MNKHKTYKGSGIRQDKIKIAEEIRKIISVASNLESNHKNIGMFTGVYCFLMNRLEEMEGACI